MSRIDYCNSLFLGCSSSLPKPLQKVQNSAARLIFKAPGQQSTSPLLKKLHWLPVSEQMKYNGACITYKCLTESTPLYQFEQNCSVSILLLALFAPVYLKCTHYNSVVVNVNHTVIGLSLAMDLNFGKLFFLPSGILLLCYPLK